MKYFSYYFSTVQYFIARYVLTKLYGSVGKELKKNKNSNGRNNESSVTKKQKVYY